MASLDFRSEWFKLCLICKPSWYFLPSFESVGFSVQKKKFNSGHLGFPIGTISAFFDLQVAPIVPTVLNQLTFWFKRSTKIDFQDLGFQIRTILSCPDISYQVSSQVAFSSGDEGQNRFQRWPPWTSDPNYFSYFLVYELPRYFLASFKSSGLLVRDKKGKIDFQDGCHGGHLGFAIGMILAIFDTEVVQIHPAKFWVNWPFASEEEEALK